jgi:hypothetical protein
MEETQLQHLHNRATRGEQLTTEEQTALNEWYAQQDQAESLILHGSAISGPVSDLKVQVANAATQLAVVTQHISEVIVENQHLRDEVAALQQRLAQQLANRPA